MVRRIERPLAPDERRELTARRDAARTSARKAFLQFGAVSVAICGVLGLLTRLASDASSWVIVIFWGAMAAVFTVWTGWPMRRHFVALGAALDEALGADRARETRVSTRRVVEFEEFEDEGACFAFDAGDGRTIFVVGQAFYADEQFPNSDFAYVEALGRRGEVLDVIMTLHGERIEPERRVGAARKLAMEPPEHLEITPVPIDRIGL